MDMENAIISLKDVSFFYIDADAPENPKELTEDDIHFVFRNLDLDLPAGVLSIIGENGIGKSTLMLLAAARRFPVQGSIEILGRNTEKFRKAAQDPAIEAERNALVSVVYQNMEFETEDNLGTVLEQVFDQGIHTSKTDWILEESSRALHLEQVKNRKFQELSKGEMQRALIAISMAYGSAITVLDEPVFAMEEKQKEESLAFLQDYAHRTERSVLFSAHNIHLCRDYADNTLLMRKDGDFVLGDSKAVCSKEELEAAYQVPMEYLHRKEALYRDLLIKGDETRRSN
ncbi:ATP-binding cassette domain-containing protein [Salinispira pacifica]|uniref:ABC transporter, ATP-binding protein n=1 Tax=Salinispira pacifica TaxID=1307761 RepID=V5WKQ5_9SPIO|nr:ATP-binding cassette domain-containing protein [Salinispira pacifica]AHC16333.1 ABC transporter, ATP-binding protein [Salinispira pacifica]